MKRTNVGSNKWLDLWNGFWEKEKGKCIKQKRAVMPETWNLENDTGVDGGDGLFDEGDGLNDEEEVYGWSLYWARGGVKFYEKILTSMKKTHFGSNEWQDLWNGFWEKEKGKCIKPETWDLENDTGGDGGDGFFDEGDELNDEEEADGWVMEVWLGGW